MKILSKKPVKPAKVIMIIITAFVVFSIILWIILIILNIFRSQKWDKVTPKDNSYYAKLVMMPEIADDIDNVYVRGLRDQEYCIETISCNTLSELYGILPYSNDTERMTALESIEEVSEKFPEIPVKNDIIKKYYAVSLPVTEEDSNGKVIPYYYFHENYIIQTESGFRFVFIVHTT